MEGESAVMALFSSQLEALKKEGKVPGRGPDDPHGRGSGRIRPPNSMPASAAARGFVDLVVIPGGAPSDRDAAAPDLPPQPRYPTWGPSCFPVASRMAPDVTNDRTVRVASGQGFWGDDLEAPSAPGDGRTDRLPDARLPGRGHHVDHAETAVEGPRKRATPAISCPSWNGSSRPAWSAGSGRFECGRRQSVRLRGGPRRGGGGERESGADPRSGWSPGTTSWIVWTTSSRLDTASRTWRPETPLETVRDRVQAANVYIGARPIVEALARGAQVVVNRALDGYGSHLRSPDPRVRVEVGGPRHARQRRRGRPPQRVRSPMLRRELLGRVVGSAGHGRRGLPPSSRPRKTGPSW